ncbi:hypothetical protein UFOVP4_18 [uncultured Caudovirales phage]|uniref:Uncharacterized protein n=1 Tax=uncultured Caudovirales phage TaxID=2100421 RepID=A0A6J5T8Y4_9CAUD|nr:hypothetical protein UFOVP4_18 [uncultured Caudovirales phage]CAB4241315.1 hypothetical protein UFOVP64_41 [uncultured Caudovirales phage]CAB5079014.1 hypothetical protein UFOVP145_55 [uncultured Caudovirales phage]
MDQFNSAWVGILGLLLGGFGAWNKLTERMTAVETRQESDKGRFDQIMVHLQRIEDKLDNKADK